MNITRFSIRLLSALAAVVGAASFSATLAHASAAAPIELHNKLALTTVDDKTVALTLDACGGAYDSALIDYLIAQRIPATVFATKKWLDRNPVGLSVLLAHKDLFDIDNHGAAHVPAVLGAGRRVYGIAGVGDMKGLTREVQGGAEAITLATGKAPKWYRGAAAEYDTSALQAIEGMGYRVAGFSVNADQGATLSKRAVAQRVAAAKPGDIIIAHMNKPRSQTAAGLMAGLAQLQQRGFQFVKLSDAKVLVTR